jgi:hypothetical protein
VAIFAQNLFPSIAGDPFGAVAEKKDPAIQIMGDDPFL